MALKPITFRGVDYPSQAAAAAAHGLQRAAVSYRTRHLKESAEEALEALVKSGIAEAPTRRGRCRVGSITFANAAVAARHFGLNPTEVARVLRTNKRMSPAAVIAKLIEEKTGRRI